MYCPEDIHAFATANDNAEVHWPIRMDNSQHIVNISCIIHKDYQFPVGVTEVLCLGYDRSEILVGNCTFHVNITQGTKYLKSTILSYR